MCVLKIHWSAYGHNEQQKKKKKKTTRQNKKSDADGLQIQDYGAILRISSEKPNVYQILETTCALHRCCSASFLHPNKNGARGRGGGGEKTKKKRNRKTFRILQLYKGIRAINWLLGSLCHSSLCYLLVASTFWRQMPSLLSSITEIIQTELWSYFQHHPFGKPTS